MEHLDDEENITIIKDSLNNEELKVADKVADEILQKEEQEQKRLLLFVLIFVLLTLFVSFAGFSLFKIKQGSNNNIINAVHEHITIVSVNTPKVWIKPCLTG